MHGLVHVCDAGFDWQLFEVDGRCILLINKTLKWTTSAAFTFCMIITFVKLYPIYVRFDALDLISWSHLGSVKLQAVLS